MKKLAIGTLIYLVLFIISESLLLYRVPNITILDCLIINITAVVSIFCLGLTKIIFKFIFCRKKDNKIIYLSYSFINNSILLSNQTIRENGFYEVWRQENHEHSVQILCFNPDTKEFQAFDRYHWSDENLRDICSDVNIYEKGELWTPINFHYTVEWLKEHMKDVECEKIH